MDWNNIPPDERIRLWRHLRIFNKELLLTEQLANIAAFFAHVPIGSRSIDFYTPSSWDTPWEMLSNNAWCTCSTSVLIFYTFILINESVDAQLILVDDSTDRFLLPLIDNQYILNYELGKISNLHDIKNDFTILEMYKKEQIRTIK